MLEGNKNKQFQNVVGDSITKLHKLKKMHEKKQIDLISILNKYPNTITQQQLFDCLEKIQQNHQYQFSSCERDFIWELISKNKNNLIQKEIKYSTFLKFIGLRSQKNLIFEQQKQQMIINQDLSILDDQLKKDEEKKNDSHQQIIQPALGQRSLQYNQYYYKQTINNIEEFETIFKQLEQAKSIFKDNQFPPQSQSLFEINSSKFQQQWKDLTWLRPTQFINGKISMFQILKHQSISRIGLGKFITPYDIIQGQLGDCYFLSSLSILATVPEIILDLFITKKINPYGIYCVKICHNGEWKAVYVDDFIPCYNQYAGPSFSKARENEIWVLIFEKAWAKLHGSYEKIASGSSSEVMRSLTGAPTKYYTLKDKQTNKINTELINVLKQTFIQKQCYFITTSTGSEDIINPEIEKITDLVPNHAYTILGFYESIQTENGSVSLIKLRNPWGNRSWRGKWSHNSQEWTEKIEQQIKLSSFYGGVFFMEVQDFQQYFTTMEICYYVPHNCYTSITLRTTPKNAAYVEMTIEQTGDYTISIIEKSQRCFPKNVQYEYSVAKLFLIQIDKKDRKIIYVNQIQKKERETWFTHNLQKGTYIVYSKVQWFDNKEHSFVLSAYGPSPVVFNSKLTKAQIGGNRLFVEACKEQQGRQLNSIFANNSIQAYYCYDLKAENCIGSLTIVNKDKRIIKMQVNFQHFQGLKLRKPFRGNSIHVNLQQNEELTIIMSIDYKGYNFKISFDNVSAY